MTTRPPLPTAAGSAHASVTRLAYTPDEAAAALGIGRTTFYDRVLPDVRVIRLGRKTLVTVVELQRWLERMSNLG